MDKIYIALIIILGIMGLIMFCMDVKTMIISGTGGIIAASFWIYHIKDTHGSFSKAPYETISAFVWLIFSFFVLISSYYDPT